MAVRDNLLEGEMSLSQCPPFYATNRRILRTITESAREEIVDLPYYRIESVELMREPRHRLAVAGVIMAFSGVIMWMLGFFTSIPAIAAGVGMILWGARGREGYYQFRTSQMRPDELARWRVPFRGSAGFITTVGEYVKRPMKWT